MDSNILKEYLVALGFKVDEPSAKKAETTLGRVDTKVMGLAKGALAAAAAVQTMVTMFAFQMEKLYYASKRTDTSVGNIKALDYAFRQLGGGAGEMQGALEGIARSIRLNPGIAALAEQLTGKSVQGRDLADVTNDLIDSLAQMPFFQAAQFGNLLGIDDNTLFTLIKYRKEFQQLQADRKQMAAEAGVDLDKASEAGKRYAVILREIWERMGLLKDATAIKALPYLEEFAKWINSILTDLTVLVGKFTTWKDLVDQFWADMKGGPKLMPKSESDGGQQSWLGRIMDGARRVARGETYSTSPGAAATTTPRLPAPTGSAAMKGTMEEKQAYLASLELKYGLPPGWLDRVWHAESSRGTAKNMTSKKGAMGDFQFMPDTWKQYGNGPMDFYSSADAAGRYFRNLSKMFGGDQAKMAAGYNWGEGNVMRKGLGAAPAETRGYVQSVAGVTIAPQTEININGVSDPQKAATLAESAVRRQNNDLVRNFSPGVR